jgi:hypothetical protein
MRCINWLRNSWSLARVRSHPQVECTGKVLRIPSPVVGPEDVSSRPSRKIRS